MVRFMFKFFLVFNFLNHFFNMFQNDVNKLKFLKNVLISIINLIFLSNLLNNAGFFLQMLLHNRVLRVQKVHIMLMINPEQQKCVETLSYIIRPMHEKFEKYIAKYEIAESFFEIQRQYDIIFQNSVENHHNTLRMVPF